MANPKSTEIRSKPSSRLLGYMAGSLMKLWSLTLRCEVNGMKGYPDLLIGERPVVYALWHNRIFTMPPIWQRTGGRTRNAVVLTSASKDGTVLATAMRLFGLGAIRGSSSRRAVSALIGMKKALADGFDVCVTPDGPRGPRYHVQPGIIKIAQATGTSIIPIHIRYGSAWRLKTWDRLVIPKPFSRVQVTFDKPRHILKGISPEEFENARIALEKCLASGSDDH